MAESEEELNSLLMKVKEETEKAGCQEPHYALLTKQRHDPNPLSSSRRHGHTALFVDQLPRNVSVALTTQEIINRKIEEERVERMTDISFLGSNITADGDCSHEIKRCLLLGRKVMTNLDAY